MKAAPLVIRGARTAGGAPIEPYWTGAGRVGEDAPPSDARTVDLDGRVLLPGFLNGHDHLDASTLPALGTPPYPNAYAWAADVQANANGDSAAALRVPLADRMFLGGFRNLLAGVTAVAHHNPFHRSLARDDFPVRVLGRYDFAHSPGQNKHLRKTYRTTDRRIPWMVHAGEGTDAQSRAELEALEAANVLRQNTVIVHAVAFGAQEAGRIAAREGAVIWCPEADRRLYGRTADVLALRAAGVRVGLGSEGPSAGVRDPLSNLAAARREGVMDDAALVELATRGTAEAARLPLGGFAAGDAADHVVVASLDRILEGDRTAVSLVMVAGRPRYGERHLMEASGVATVPVFVEGAERAVEEGLGRRAAGLVRRHPALRRVSWLADVRFGDGR